MKRINLPFALALLASTIYPVASQSAQKKQAQERIPVYVPAKAEEANDGFVEPGQKVRQKNLAYFTATIKKGFLSLSKKGITLVDNPVDADVAVEVIGPSLVDTPNMVTTEDSPHRCHHDKWTTNRRGARQS